MPGGLGGGMPGGFGGGLPGGLGGAGGYAKILMNHSYYANLHRDAPIGSIVEVDGEKLIVIQPG
jgi:hypothetical protein